MKMICSEIRVGYSFSECSVGDSVVYVVAFAQCDVFVVRINFEQWAQSASRQEEMVEAKRCCFCCKAARSDRPKIKLLN